MYETRTAFVVSAVTTALVAGSASVAASETKTGEAPIMVPGITTKATKQPSVYHPSNILKKVAAGADTLKLVTYPLKDEPQKTLLTVSDRKSIAELLAGIDTPPVTAGSVTAHLCRGHPIIQLFRKNVLAAAFSFDHVHLLRPLSENLWDAGDVEVTQASARAVAKWFKKHGYAVYQDEIDKNQRELEKLNAFYAVFPTTVAAVLKGTSLGSSNDDETGDPDPLAVRIPDEVKRAGVICHALGILDERWFGYSKTDELLLLWSRRISPPALVSAIDAFPDGDIRLTGAARVFFDNRVHDGALMGRVDPPTADRLGARLAAHVFSTSNRHNAGELPRLLGRLPGPNVERVLRNEAARVSVVDEGRCADWSSAIPPLSSLVVLSGRRKADPDVITQATLRSWQCLVNRATARISDLLASNRLPDHDDIRMADEAGALATLERLKEFPNREAIDLAFDVLLRNERPVVARNTAEWLSSLMSPPRPGEKPVLHTEGELVRWWGDACYTWQPPISGKKAMIDGGTPGERSPEGQ